MERTTPTIVVFDHNWGGHIPAAHRLIVESVLRGGWRVISLSGGSEEVGAHVNSVLPSGRDRLIAPSFPNLGRSPLRTTKLGFLRWIPGGFALWSQIRRSPKLRARHALYRWEACRAALEQVRPHLNDKTLLFFPYLDDMLEPRLSCEDIAVPLPWAGLHMSISDLRDPILRGGMERRMHLLRQPGCRGLAVFDEAIIGLLGAVSPQLPVTCLPDPADDALAPPSSPLIQELERRAMGRKIVGLLGHLSEAKNLPLFLDLATAPHNRDLFFLMAGQYEPLGVAPPVRQRLAAAASGKWENVWALPNRIPAERDFNRLLKRLDAVFAVYRDFSRSSGILTKAGLFRRPIVVSSGYCMADRVEAYRLGLAVAQDDAAGCESAIRRLLADGTPGVRYEAFAHDFSLTSFQAKLMDFFSTCLGGLEKPNGEL